MNLQQELEQLNFDAIVDLEKHYLVNSYSRFPVVFRRGRGCYLYDIEGKRYLDMLAGIGVNALGHNHPRIIRALKEQASLLIHCSNLYYHPYQGLLARRLAEISGLEKCFFCNSGAEAIEGALKMVRAHGRKKSPEKTKIVALENSFHGRTIGALSITGQAKYREPFEPLLPNVQFVPLNDVSALEEAMDETVAGLFVECIQGEGGVYPATEEFLRAARRLCNKFGALLVIDEIQTGLGRTGKYFAYQLFDPPIKPDIVTVAKPLACGLPLGAIIANNKAASTITPGMHGSTFGGGALACRLALEFLEVLDELLPQIFHMGGYLKRRLEELKLHYRYIKEVRGAGLMIGMELLIPCKEIVNEALKAGLLISCTHDNVIRFLPPYIITENDVDRAIQLLEKPLLKGREIYIQSGLATA